jgi:hypothetical protein
MVKGSDPFSLAMTVKLVQERHKSRPDPVSPVTFAPRLLSCLRIDRTVADPAARLDTGLVASDYPGGSPTR